MARAAKTKAVKRTYSNEDRSQAAIQYAISGVMSKVSRDMGIPRETLNVWQKAEWWDATIADIHQAKAMEHRQAYSRLVDKSLAKAEKGIDALGDSLTANDIKSLVITGAASTDKMRLADSLPTSISTNSNTQAMQQMADLFASMSSRNQVNEDKIKAIEETIVSDQ